MRENEGIGNLDWEKERKPGLDLNYRPKDPL